MLFLSTCLWSFELKIKSRLVRCHVHLLCTSPVAVLLECLLVCPCLCNSQISKHSHAVVCPWGLMSLPVAVYEMFFLWNHRSSICSVFRPIYLNSLQLWSLDINDKMLAETVSRCLWPGLNSFHDSSYFFLLGYCSVGFGQNIDTAVCHIVLCCSRLLIHWHQILLFVWKHAGAEQIQLTIDHF